MMQFGDLPTGGYFWRPPYINHGAFANENGIIAIGRTDAHLHNYFHHNPWTTPKENADRAAARLRRMRPSLYKWVRSPDGHNHFTDFEYPHCCSRPRSRLRVVHQIKCPNHSKDLKYWSPSTVLGPWAAQILADMGALRVIKVEAPFGDSNRQLGAETLEWRLYIQ